MRAYTLGNGSMHVGVDERGQIRDLYYPQVGRENHVSGRTHRIGVYVDGAMHWTSGAEWEITARAHRDTMAGSIDARSGALGLRLTTRDIVYNERNIFLREVVITNEMAVPRAVSLFFGQEFQVGETVRGDTAYFDPRAHAIIHYEGKRMFLVRAEATSGEVFDEWSVGLSGIEGKEGTYRDADDGMLSKNGIEHGQVDSVIRCSMNLHPGESKTFHYWICAGEYFRDVFALNQYVRDRTPEYLMGTASDYWRAWLQRQGLKFSQLPQDIVDTFTRSLLVIRAHTDREGAIIASSDTGILNQGRDTYAYTWPRDAAYAARALILAGDGVTAKKFFEFCNRIISDDGYFMHKYLPDGSVGSSWHPWYRNGAKELPIQADETAIVLVVLREYYQVTRDLEFVESVFNSLIKNAAQFLVWHTDETSGLPKPSYDLWEEHYCISTYTAASTYGALKSAEFFADLLGKHAIAETYRKTAEKMQEGIMTHLYNSARGAFRKAAFVSADGSYAFDDTLDFSTTFSVFEFGVLPQSDPRLQKSFETMERELEVKIGIGGMPRFTTDVYYRAGADMPPNPWTVTTLWKAQYLLKKAKTKEELDAVEDLLMWAVARATPSGLLSEQVHPVTGEALSVTPLVWSHAEFVTTVIEYLQRMDDLNLCKVCYPLRRR